MYFKDSIWWFSSCEVLTFKGETILQHCYSIRMTILFILKEHHSDCKYEPVPVGVGRPRSRDPPLTDKLAVSRWAIWSVVQMFGFASAAGVNRCPCSSFIQVDLFGRERGRIGRKTTHHLIQWPSGPSWKWSAAPKCCQEEQFPLGSF